jgi:glycosyltransferase involved in cell wall biosynthesis
VNLTIILPCLNEIETLEICIQKSLQSISSLGLSGEVLVADNGSEDGSQELALSLGARVINVPIKGYGSALIAGIHAAESDYIIMGDADDSYALDDLQLFIVKLNEGFDLVMGNRFQGGIAPGAMPWLHKYLGNPFLSWLSRLFFRVPIGDFHCGLRGFRTNAIRELNLKSTGMEFASEMVVKASLHKLTITEVPTTLKPDGRSRAPHLRTWRDGWRHLIFLLAASPRFLFLYPGLFLLGLGVTGFVLTLSGPIYLLNYFFDSNSYLFSIGLILVGIQTILIGILNRIFSSNFGMLPKTKAISKFESWFTLERGIIIGIFLVLASIVGFAVLLFDWTGAGFNNFSPTESLRISGSIVLALVTGIQILFASFFASVLQKN